MNNSAQFLARVARWSRSMNRMVRVTALAVVMITAYILMRPAITAEGSLICGLEEHTHNELCYETVTEYEPVLVCPLPEITEHEHDETCYDEDGNLICDVQRHEHDETCYIMEETETVILVCEIPEHTHTSDCFDIRPIKLDSDGTYEHTHTEDCYRGDVLVCTLEDTGTESEDFLPDENLSEGTELNPEAAAEFVDEKAAVPVMDDFSPEALALDESELLLAASETQMLMTSMSKGGHDGSEENPFTAEDYGTITVNLDAKLYEEDPFGNLPSVTFQIVLFNTSSYVPFTWFEYEIPFHWDKYPNAKLFSGVSDKSIPAKDGTVIGEWEITPESHSIRCFFNANANKYNNVSMLFTLTLESGEEHGYEFDMKRPFVIIQKLDSYTREPLEGVTFALFSEDGVELAREVTDENGHAYFYIIEGNNYLSFYEPYYIQEMYDTELPDFLKGYARDDTQRWFVSVDDVIPFVWESTYYEILQEHPGILEINQTNREIYIEGLQALEILNDPVYTLPETGGVGALICYGSGTLILLTAAIIWKCKRRSVSPPPPRIR